jgi:cytochrome c oxidase subunit 3
MPATFTRIPADTERKDTGIGGKPPADRRPTGGGGEGDDWERRGHGRRGQRGPREMLGRYRMLLVFGLAGDLMFFVALVCAFFARQSGGHFSDGDRWVLDWRPTALPPILYLNTAIMLLSSLTMEVGRRSFFREADVMDEWLGLGRPTVRAGAPWLAATAALGSLFLVGQWIAWKQLVAEGVYFASNPSSHFFYLITGAHGLHLLLGVVALASAMFALVLVRRLEKRQVVVDCAAWYWHAMGLFWLLLFGLLVFCQ